MFGQRVSFTALSKQGKKNKDKVSEFDQQSKPFNKQGQPSLVLMGLFLHSC